MAIGLRCVIAESFGDIFYGNCFQNGLLPIRLSEAVIHDLFEETLASEGMFTVDLERCILTTPTGRRIAFVVDPLRRESLLAGLDDVGLTLKCVDEIESWQATDRLARPWIWTAGASRFIDSGKDQEHGNGRKFQGHPAGTDRSNGANRTSGRLAAASPPGLRPG
jgi:3-isopropylmalate/(R)-2-methylmalate dehydratase small subunit